MAELPAPKLTVILHADVIGSTVMVQEDESLAHARIVEAFNSLSHIVEEYGGIAHEIRGDALLAEFSRASDAVAAAIEFQNQHADSLQNLQDSIRSEIRLGIAMGEVIVADNTMTGAGVVMAQRLEQLAEAGGVVIQGAVYETLPSRLPYHFESLGKQKLKGFVEPVEAYRLSKGTRSGKTARGRSRRWIAITATASLLVISGVLGWLEPWESDNRSEQNGYGNSETPSIAILPFLNLSADAEQEYFADGLTEDLITDLSKLSGLFVIARNSAFSYKGKGAEVSQVADELGVRYVLEGSVRRAGDQVRINTQLIDASTGGHVWAERYDGLLNDIFSMQDRVNEQIIDALSIELVSGEKTSITREETYNAEAHDAFLKGWEQFRRKTPENHAIARDYFKQALEIDPDYNRALSALAALYWDVHVRVWSPALKENEFALKEIAMDYLDRALENPTALAFVVESRIHLRHGRHDKAITAARHAVKLSRNDPEAQIALARSLIFSGRPEESLPVIEIAERLDPYNEPEHKMNRGLAEFGLDQYATAAELFARAFELNSNNYLASAGLASAYGHLDQKEKAQEAWQSYVNSEHTEFYAYNIGTALSFFPYKISADKERLAEGWRSAGIPETEVEQYKSNISQ